MYDISDHNLRANAGEKKKEAGVGEGKMGKICCEFNYGKSREKRQKITKGGEREWNGTSTSQTSITESLTEKSPRIHNLCIR